KVVRAAYGHPCCLNECPLEPPVAKGQHTPMMGLASAAVGGGHQATVSAKLGGLPEPLDRVDLQGHHAGENNANARDAGQTLCHRIRTIVALDCELQLAHDCIDQFEHGQLFVQKHSISLRQTY